MGRGDHALFRRELRGHPGRSRACGASARPRSISPGSRPAASTRYWERDLSAWDIAAGVLLVREAGGFVTDLPTSERDHARPGDIIAGNETMHRELLAPAAQGLSHLTPLGKPQDARVIAASMCHHCGRFIAGAAAPS